MELVDQIKSLRNKIEKEISQFTEEQVEQIRVQILGKKGELTQILRELKNLSAEDKATVGALANETRQTIESLIEDRKQQLQLVKINAQLESQTIDVTLPGNANRTGIKHILQSIQDQIEDLFVAQGYQVIYGSEIETDEYNFERMNLPQDHPARDMQDTFYIDASHLLRTQTSAMQARTMEKHDFTQGPLKMISPGVVYRRDDDDATHSHEFHQIEGLVVGEQVTMADLKGTLELLIETLFGKGHAVRLRPSYFPFTEPSIEVDVSWNLVNEKTKPEDIKWVEVLGAGMVHPHVLEMSGVNTSKYSGFAFGLGPDRLAMIKYGIEDIRNFYLNDMRFLEQFKQVIN